MVARSSIDTLNSGGSRPSDKGEARSSRPRDKWGGGRAVSKHILRPFGPHFSLFEASTEKVGSAKLRKREHENKTGRNWEEERSFSRHRPLFPGRP